MDNQYIINDTIDMELVNVLGPNPKPSKWWLVILDIWNSYIFTAVKKRS